MSALIVGVSLFSAYLTSEYQIKTTFLYNLARMVEWPESQSPLTICLFREDPFGNTLDSHKKIKNRSLIFKKDLSLSDINQCHQRARKCRVRVS